MQGKKLAVSCSKHISLMPVVFLSFFIFLLLSSALCVHLATVSVFSRVCMFECVIMRVCACGFIEILGNTVGITRGICSSVVLALVSVTLVCAIYKWCVSSSAFFYVVLLFLGWHRAFCCSCTKYLSPL